MTLGSTFSLKLSVLLFPLSCPCLFIQSAASVTQLQSFNVHGTVRLYPNEAISGAKVIFKGERISKTVYTDEKGSYEANLPVGFYTMLVNPLVEGLRTYQRPLFRIAASTNITWDVSILPGIPCDLAWPDGHVTTNDEAGDFCGGWEFFPVSSQDGIPFQLLINYPARQRTDHETVYISRSLQNIKDPVFVAYNLFTLEADRVTYDEKTRTLEAMGNVGTFNEKGEKQTADSMTFKIDNGEATRLH